VKGNPIQITVVGDAESKFARILHVIYNYIENTTALGNVIRAQSSASSENIPFCVNYIDNIGAGTYTYYLKVNSIVNSDFNFGEVTGPMMTLLEIAGAKGDTGPTGPGIAPLYGSFISNTSQSPDAVNPDTVPVAITYSSCVAGTIATSSGNSYPNSQIVIPTTGVYRVLFSAQCLCTNGKHYLRNISPAVNNTSVPDSNTRIRLDANVENCLTVEYILAMSQNDIFQLFMIADSANIGIVSFTGNPLTSPAIPNIPSMILDIQRIIKIII
jgi:hypothetical protein